jgi:hypothetical protein
MTASPRLLVESWLWVLLLLGVATHQDPILPSARASAWNGRGLSDLLTSYGDGDTSCISCMILHTGLKGACSCSRQSAPLQHEKWLLMLTGVMQLLDKECRLTLPGPP